MPGADFGGDGAGGDPSGVRVAGVLSMSATRMALHLAAWPHGVQMWKWNIALCFLLAPLTVAQVSPEEAKARLEAKQSHRLPSTTQSATTISRSLMEELTALRKENEALKREVFDLNQRNAGLTALLDAKMATAAAHSAEDKEKKRKFIDGDLVGMTRTEAMDALGAEADLVSASTDYSTYKLYPKTWSPSGGDGHWRKVYEVIIRNDKIESFAITTQKSAH